MAKATKPKAGAPVTTIAAPIKKGPPEIKVPKISQDLTLTDLEVADKLVSKMIIPFNSGHRPGQEKRHAELMGYHKAIQIRMIEILDESFG